MKDLSKSVWDRIVYENVRLFLNEDPKQFHAQVDWSSQGFVYLLFARLLEKGRLMGLNLRGEESNQASSYLGELRGICWALQNIK